jgi:SWI/SNF-related matrix-associated actin-dependent regulator 1 of chromatin subfamily A
MSTIRVERYGSQYIARCTYEQKDIVKAAGFRWDGAAKQWYTTDAAIAAKLDDVEGLRQRVAAANTAKVEAIEMSRASDSDADIPRPDGLEYLPYQRAGIAYARRFPTVLIGDDMGLGKTIQAVGIINDDSTINRVLVICPASLRLNWRRELKKWLVTPRQIGIVDDGKSYPAIADVVIINYDLASKHAAALRAKEWDLVIIDEAHYLKSPDAKRTVAILGRKQSKKHDAVAPIPARRKVFLTGTPIPNRPVEGWWAAEQLGVMSNFFAFAKRYCAAVQNRWGWDFTGASNLAELQEKLRAGGMIRRLKADVLKELPAKRRCVIELPANGAAKVVKAEADAWADHEATIDALRVAVELAKASENPEDYREAVLKLNKATQVAFTEMSKRRHDTAVAKVPYVVEHLRGIIEQGRKVVCMAHHKDVVDAIMAEFPDAVKVTGDVSMADRQSAVDRFQNDPLCLLFVGNIQAAGVGLTLTASSHVVFAELDWVPGNVTQAEDRCHRIGQTDSVLIEHLVLEGSMDARMATTLIAKQSVLTAALDELPEQPVVAPVRERGCTEDVSRKQIVKEAAELSPEAIAEIHAKLQRLAGVCDGARELDGAGFNRFDSAIGKSLAMAHTLTQKQAALGARLVNKYRRQLG